MNQGGIGCATPYDAKVTSSAPQIDDHSNILIIDDDPVLTRLLAGMLGSIGDVQVAHTGTEGLQLARQEQPDLILLDVAMPGQDGFDIISALKTDPLVRHIPVIFITGEVLPEIESHCLEAGGADYIAKPVNSRVLRARARTHLLLKKQADILADLAIRDSLTDALSSGVFEELLSSECRRSVWKRRPISLVLIDIDDFANYNEVYGSVAGDDVLLAIHKAISGLANNPGDVIARLAGDRFAVLLPEGGARDGAELAGRICSAVRHLNLRNSGARSADIVTVSVGLVSASEGAPAAELMATAADALARAKKSGRNRVSAQAR